MSSNISKDFVEEENTKFCLNSFKRSSAINLYKFENDCSTDEIENLKCCSFRGIKGLLPTLKHRVDTNDTIPPVSRCGMPQSNDHKTSEKCLQIYEYQTTHQLGIISKTFCNKNEERMYDLAHLLFKISDLLLQLSEFEKKACVKETVIRRMLNLVKADIMKSFLKGNTRYVTMNKIISRLIYLDAYIKQLNAGLNVNSEYLVKYEEQKTDCPCFCVSEMSEIPKVKVIKKHCNCKQNTKGLETQMPTKEIFPVQDTVGDEMKTIKNTETKENPKSKECFNQIVDKTTQTEQSIIYRNVNPQKMFSATTSYEDIYVNPNGKLPTIFENQIWKKRHETSLKLINKGQILNSNKKEISEPPQNLNNNNKVDKEIAATILDKQNEASKKVERDMQTEKFDEIIFDDEIKNFQTVSMNILCSKTHIKYIIPEWMEIHYNQVDTKPKILCKQDLEDGLALTSYKLDRDGTIHFTFAFTSEKLSNLLNENPAVDSLLGKIREVRSIWSESARLLYEQLVEDYDGKKIKPKNPKSEPNLNNKIEGNINPKSRSEFKLTKK